jgi:hypothetical protein
LARYSTFVIAQEEDPTMKTASPDGRVAPLSRILFVLAALLAPALLPSIQAQVLYGSIVGSVKDATGAVLPGATVIVTHNETKATRETTTDENGAYRFPTVQTGTYDVVVKMTGFQTFTRPNVPVTLNSSRRP